MNTREGMAWILMAMALTALVFMAIIYDDDSGLITDLQGDIIMYKTQLADITHDLDLCRSEHSETHTRYMAYQDSYFACDAELKQLKGKGPEISEWFLCYSSVAVGGKTCPDRRDLCDNWFPIDDHELMEVLCQEVWKADQWPSP